MIGSSMNETGTGRMRFASLMTGLMVTFLVQTCVAQDTGGTETENEAPTGLLNIIFFGRYRRHDHNLCAARFVANGSLPDFRSHHDHSSKGLDARWTG